MKILEWIMGILLLAIIFGFMIFWGHRTDAFVDDYIKNHPPTSISEMK